MAATDDPTATQAGAGSILTTDRVGALLALAALGGLVLIRLVFKGALGD